MQNKFLLKSKFEKCTDKKDTGIKKKNSSVHSTYIHIYIYTYIYVYNKIRCE